MADTKKGTTVKIIRFWGNRYSLSKLLTSSLLSLGNKSEDREFFEQWYIPQESSVFKPYPKI